MFDLLITGGRIVDGSGNPWFRADVGIEGDRIRAIGQLAGAEARQCIDVGDKVVAPGFVQRTADQVIQLDRVQVTRIFVPDPLRDRKHYCVVGRIFPRLKVVAVHPEKVVELLVAVAEIAAKFPALLAHRLHAAERRTGRYRTAREPC